ncbi:MAG TPA: sigma-70 family RNA polymerase sigma factor [Dongiaceae bacterium]|nr:sigma-70 family RNA polymerase sigma factor [Dongiaceae bacterium]
MVDTGKPAEFQVGDKLLARAKAGDAQAFCELAAQQEVRLLEEARGLCRDQSTAEDLAAEALAEAWRSLARYDQTCRLSTWLFSILLHRYQKHLRRARSRPIPLAQLPATEVEAHQQEGESVPSAAPSPAEAAEQRESDDRIRGAIESLPEKHRQVVLLRFFEDASLREIAALLGCSVGTVKSRLHYALEKLREMEGRLNLSELRGDKEV